MAEDIIPLGFDVDSNPFLVAAKNMDAMNAASSRVSKSAYLIEKQLGVLRNTVNSTASTSKSLSASQVDISNKIKLASSSASQQDAVLERLQAQYIATANAATRTGTAFGGMHASAGNVFAQLNDIGVMMASGQNPFVLALQQGTQLNQVWASMGKEGRTVRGVFGMLGAGLMQFANPMGIATIATIAGASALVQWGVSAIGAKDDADLFNDSMDGLSEQMRTIEDITSILERSLYDLREEYGVAAERTREFALSQAQLVAGQAAQRMADQVAIMDEMIGRFTHMERGWNNLGELVTNNNDALKDLQGTFKVNESGAKMLFAAFEQLDNAMTFESQQAALQNLLRHFDTLGVSLNDIPPDINRALQEMIMFSNMTDRAAQLMAQLRAEAANVTIGTGWVFDPATDMPPPAIPNAPRRGGGGGANARERELEAFINSLMTEREQLEKWRTEQMELLAQYNDAELEAIGGHNEAKLRLEQEYQARLSELQKSQYEGVRTAREGAIAAFQDFMGTLSGDSKAAAVALLAVNTALSISQAIQNTAVAATRALAELGPIAGPPAAAKIKAYGAAQVAMIAANAALRVGSMGSGGSSAPTGASSGNVTATPERIVRVDFNGPAWARDLVEGLATQLFEASEDGTRVIFAR